MALESLDVLIEYDVLPPIFINPWYQSSCNIFKISIKPPRRHSCCFVPCASQLQSLIADVVQLEGDDLFQLGK